MKLKAFVIALLAFVALSLSSISHAQTVQYNDARTGARIFSYYRGESVRITILNNTTWTNTFRVVALVGNYPSQSGFSIGQNTLLPNWWWALVYTPPVNVYELRVDELIQPRSGGSYWQPISSISRSN